MKELIIARKAAQLRENQTNGEQIQQEGLVLKDPLGLLSGYYLLLLL